MLSLDAKGHLGDPTVGIHKERGTHEYSLISKGKRP